MRKWLNGLIIGLGILMLLLKLGNWSVRHSHPLPPLPQPNGYDALLAAAGGVKPPPPDLIDLSSEQLRQLADQNRPALEQARKALQMESRVAIKPTRDWDEHHDDDLTKLKRLAVALGLEAKFQLRNQQTNEAVRCNLDLFHLAQTARNGGLIIDGITGLTIEAIGVVVLQAELPRLDASGCRQAALELETLNRLREPPATTFATDKSWSAQRYGLIDSIGAVLARKTIAARQTKFIARSQDVARRTQHLMLRLAAQAYQLENQKPPANVSALVPDYLQAVPLNLETGKEIQDF